MNRPLQLGAKYLTFIVTCHCGLAVFVVLFTRQSNVQAGRALVEEHQVEMGHEVLLGELVQNIGIPAWSVVNVLGRTYLFPKSFILLL